MISLRICKSADRHLRGATAEVTRADSVDLGPHRSHQSRALCTETDMVLVNVVFRKYPDFTHTKHVAGSVGFSVIDANEVDRTAGTVPRSSQCVAVSLKTGQVQSISAAGTLVWAASNRAPWHVVQATVTPTVFTQMRLLGFCLYRTRSRPGVAHCLCARHLQSDHS